MIDLTPTQGEAVRAIVDWFGDRHRQEFYLAGYAGTGKSTLAEVAINDVKERHRICEVRTGAYTGKAAHVLRKKGAPDPGTIHSLIYTPVEDEETGETRFELDPLGKAATADLILLDECSMVDRGMADDLRSFGKKILVMGDPGQLPPVNGHGAFTNREPDFFLNEIHRQAADNPIIRLATMARQGQQPSLGDYGSGVRVVPFDAAAGEYVYDDDTQVICGLNRVRWTLTQKMRAWKGYGGHLPAPGERVLCCRNNRDLGIFNGQLGTLDKIEPAPRGDDHLWLTADLEDAPHPLRVTSHPYLFAAHFGGPTKRPKLAKDVSEFDWGYALTCHKSQGSQWPRVTIVDDSRSFRDDRWNWLYTAITRAESELTLIARG